MTGLTKNQIAQLMKSKDIQTKEQIVTIVEYYRQVQAENFQDRPGCNERSALSVLYRNREEMTFAQNQEFAGLIDEANTDEEIDLIVQAIAIVVELK